MSLHYNETWPNKTTFCICVRSIQDLRFLSQFRSGGNLLPLHVTAFQISDNSQSHHLFFTHTQSISSLKNTADRLIHLQISMNARPFPVHVTKTLDVRTSMVHTVVNVKQDLQEMDLHARVRSLIISPLQRPFFCFTLL